MKFKLKKVMIHDSKFLVNTILSFENLFGSTFECSSKKLKMMTLDAYYWARNKHYNDFVDNFQVLPYGRKKSNMQIRSILLEDSFLLKFTYVSFLLLYWITFVRQ